MIKLKIAKEDTQFRLHLLSILKRETVGVDAIVFDQIDHVFNKVMNKSLNHYEDRDQLIDKLTSDEDVFMPLQMYKIHLPKNGCYLRDYPTIQLSVNSILSFMRRDKNINIMNSLIGDRQVIDLLTLKDICIKVHEFEKCINRNYTFNIENITYITSKLDKYAYEINMGKLIVFEGCDTVGKDYILNMIVFDGNYIYTREPGGTEISEKIRDIILDNKYTDAMSYKTEVLLYTTSRAQHVDEVITPALESGLHVICNRFFHSTFVYQLSRRTVHGDQLVNLTKYAISDVRPDLTFSFYASDFSTIENRLKEKSGKDRLENESIQFHKKVNDMYETLSTNPYLRELCNLGKIVNVDVSKLPAEEIKTEVLREIKMIVPN